MATVHAHLVAVMVAAMAVLIGSLLGGALLETTLDVSSVFALFGFSICLVRFMTGQALELYNRFGDVIVLGIMLMF